MLNKFLPSKQVTLNGTAHQPKKRAEKYTYNTQCLNSKLNMFYLSAAYLQKCRSSPGHLSPQVRHGAPAPMSWAKR
jgi:hypothetical protein